MLINCEVSHQRHTPQNAWGRKGVGGACSTKGMQTHCSARLCKEGGWVIHGNKSEQPPQSHYHRFFLVVKFSFCINERLCSLFSTYERADLILVHTEGKNASKTIARRSMPVEVGSSVEENGERTANI